MSTSSKRDWKSDNVDSVCGVSGNEIITLCIGQCGIFTGNEYYKTIMNEHKIDIDGKFLGDINKNVDKLLLNKINTYFENDYKTNKYIPRSMFIDIDKTSVDKIRSSPLGSLINDNNMISSEFGEPSIIFANGYYSKSADIIDNVMDKIRNKIEICDYYQGTNMIHSIGGGFGSGFGSLLLSKLNDNYPKKRNFTFTFWPSSIHNFHNNVYEIYNTILSINELLQHSQINFIFNNSLLIKTIKSKCNDLINPTYNDLNWISSLILSGITSSFRFNSEPNLCSNLKKMDSYFRLFPRLHFLNISYSPFFNKYSISKKYNDHNISIINDCWNNDISDVRIENGKLMQTATFYKSNNQKAINLMNDRMKNINQRYGDDFVTWIVNNHCSAFIYDGDFHCYSNKTSLMATTIMNTTATKGIFQMVSAMFNRQYRRKAFWWIYKREGIDAMHFQNADKNIRDLIWELQDKQDAYYDDYDYDDDDDDDDDDDEDF